MSTHRRGLDEVFFVVVPDEHDGNMHVEFISLSLEECREAALRTGWDCEVRGIRLGYGAGYDHYWPVVGYVSKGEWADGVPDWNKYSYEYRAVVEDLLRELSRRKGAGQA